MDTRQARKALAMRKQREFRENHARVERLARASAQRQQTLQRLALREERRERARQKKDEFDRTSAAANFIKHNFGWNVHFAEALQTLAYLEENQAENDKLDHLLVEPDIDLEDRDGDSDAVKRRKQLRRHNKNVQLGRGISSTSRPQFTVTQTAASQEDFPRFRSAIYRGEFDVTHNLHEIDLLKMAERIDDLFRDFIADKLAKGETEDYIAVNVQHTQLSQGINVSSKVKNFDYTEFANRIFKTSQSNAEWLATGKFHVEVIVTKRASGAGFPGKRTRAPETPTEAVERRRCLITIANPQNGVHGKACGYWAIVLGRAYWLYGKKRHDWRLWRENAGSRIPKAAIQFCTEAGLDYTEPLTCDSFSRAANFLAPHFQLIVIDGNTTKYAKLFEGPECARQIYLFLVDDHYHLVTKVAALFKKDYFCYKCWCGWKNDGRHVCKFTCKHCRQPGVCDMTTDQELITCNECGRQFSGTLCYQKHREHAICKNYRRCTVCEKDYDTYHPHECNKLYCPRCKKHDTGAHQCFITRKDIDKLILDDSKYKAIVAFDIESELEPKDNGLYEHKANLLCAQVYCDSCYDLDRYEKRSNIECLVCGPSPKTFTGYECVSEFGDFLYHHLAKRVAKNEGRVYVFAHNFQRYDGHFVFRDLFNRAFDNVEPVMTGLKLLKLDVGNIRFVDSLSFFQLPLARLPSAFGFAHQQKGDFPHKFNRAINWNYEGCWPEKSYYDYDRKNERDKHKFDAWYETVASQTFNLQHELKKYCHQDVDILMSAVQRFRKLFKDITSIDPITRNFTLASIGLETYRAKFLEDDETLGVTPVAGYTARKQSSIAKAWLDYIEKDWGIPLEREAIRGPYYADGAHEKTVFEYNGCFWHGCRRCFANDPHHREQHAKRYLEWQEKEKYYERQGYELITIWDCQLRALRRQDESLNQYLTDRQTYYRRLFTTHVDLRESLVGGRTNNLKFHYTIKEDEKIHYYDVTSEYPYVLKNFEYPVGHPIVVNRDFDYTLETYFGFVKCTVLPPKRLYLPLLPHKSQQKLKFVLCRTCAEECNQLSCTHTDEQRQLTSTFTTPELKEALRLGYVVTEIFEVYHYEKRSSNLFRKYIDTWLQVKQEASSWPVEKQNDFEYQQRFIELYNEREGILLDAAKMTERNEGLRFIAKLMLNSFWGKLAQKCNMAQTAYCSTLHDYYSLLQQQTEGHIQILGVKAMSQTAFLVSYEMSNLDDCKPGNTNVAIASFVTSYARLHLYKQLEKVVNVAPERLLYFDTDSIIFVQRQGEQILKLGNYLGDLTNELEEYGAGAYIRRFVSGGPKNYGFEVVKPDGCTVVKIKAKGIRVDAQVLNVLTLEKMTEFVQAYTRGVVEAMKVKQHRFSVNPKTHEVFSADVFKLYRVVSEKRRVVGNDTFPFGYVD